MQQIAESVWILRYPQSLFGAQIGRTVTILRLNSGDLAIHSTGPFTHEDRDAICNLGRPAILVEATLFHDTFSKVGRAAFPELPYAAPEGFTGANIPMCSIAQKWPNEFSVLELDGMPRVREQAILHRPSRTLIVADLVFNFGNSATAWTRHFFRWAGGVQEFPGVTRLFRSCIRDRAAFINATDEILRWDFDRLIVGHGDVIESDAKEQLRKALTKHGLCSAKV